MEMLEGREICLSKRVNTEKAESCGSGGGGGVMVKAGKSERQLDEQGRKEGKCAVKGKR